MPIRSRQTYKIPAMGSFGIVMSVDVSDAARMSDVLADRLKRKATLFRMVGRQVRAIFSEHFRAGGVPPWEPLAASTVKQKQRMIRAGSIPKRTLKGNIPRRYFQFDQQKLSVGFSGHTILVRTGALRDSWCRKGARGNVERIGTDEAEYGSQLTIQRETTLGQLKAYHLLTKKAARQMKHSGSANARFPLAEYHERTAQRMPTRPVATLGEDEMGRIAGIALSWLMGPESTGTEGGES